MRKYYKNSLTASLQKKLPKKAFLMDQSHIEQLKTGAQIVLSLAAAAGVVAVALVAPNALKLFKSVPNLRKGLRKNNRPVERIAQTFYYLKRRGYVKLLPKGNELLVEVTSLGKKRLLDMNFENLQIQKAKKWEGKWWFVFADIPTKPYRTQANTLRRKIKKLGLYPLQRTVWVYPFDPTQQIVFVGGRLQIDRFITVLRADKIDEDDEKTLKAYFKEQKII